MKPMSISCYRLRRCFATFAYDDPAILKFLVFDPCRAPGSSGAPRKAIGPVSCCSQLPMKAIRQENRICALRQESHICISSRKAIGPVSCCSQLPHPSPVSPSPCPSLEPTPVLPKQGRRNQAAAFLLYGKQL